MSMTKGTRPIDANNLARRIREYMDDFPNATTRLATCRAILSMLGDENQTPSLNPITREQVEKVWKGKWITKHVGNGWDDWDQVTCSVCGYHNYKPDFPLDGFCPMCGSAMTDKAVDMVMERLEALYE